MYNTFKILDYEEDYDYDGDDAYDSSIHQRKFNIELQFSGR